MNHPVFEKLTPIHNSNLEIYESALDFAFKNNDVRNIAISGAYGAGKSSVIASYQTHRPKRKFMYISLAHFQTEDDNDPPRKNAFLEGRILNQLIHQIPTENIPKTNFRVKRVTNRSAIWHYTIALLISILCVSYILCFESWTAFVQTLSDSPLKTLLTLSCDPMSQLMIGIILLVLLGYFIFQIISVQKNKNIFRKLSFQGNEIEIFKDSNDSYFDKYLNEVLYLFENVEADAIIFEDIDRFETTSIFERLREINTLVNLNRSSDNPLRFLYLLRDDIFVSKDRTKFFDYIIPVIPVLDSSNSYDQFISHLNKNQITDKFDSSFLQGLSLYVDDMRLLKNICNEFLIYFHRLNTIELNCNKMLALITYKNLFPQDFNQLQLNRGFVFSIFSKKASIIKKEVDFVQNEIDDKKKEIEQINNEFLEAIAELDIVYKDMRTKADNMPYYNGKRSSEQKKVAEWYDTEYPRREKTIKERLGGRKQDLENAILALEQKLMHLPSLSLSELITRDNISDVFKIPGTDSLHNAFTNIVTSPYFDLLKYLIRNGYIDETYSDYMSYFYENSLNRIDKIFLRSVTDKRAKEYTYELRDPKKVFSFLTVADFEQEEILNFNLLSWLLENQSNSKVKECLEKMVVQLKKAIIIILFQCIIQQENQFPN